MLRLWARMSPALFALISIICQAQTPIPDQLPQLNYPPIGIAAHVQGDVVVSFHQTAEGKTTDVTPVSGPPMLQGVAVENVKAWRFPASAEAAGPVYNVTFHFQLDPSADGYDSSSPTTKVEPSEAGGIRVLSTLWTGRERSECPSDADRVPPTSILSGDFVEVQRWNETVRVSADGTVAWSQGKISRHGHITPGEANSLLERFRTQSVWALCGNYYQAGLMDGGGSSFTARIGGRDKSVSDYGEVAPPIFEHIELAIDDAANTHQWRHGDPKTESIVEIDYEYLPKPGKTKLMDAALSGDKAEVQAALAAGEKLTDVDASGWTPLMYTAGACCNSVVKELIAAGADVNARSKRGETALMASAVTGTADEDLLKAGADVNAVNNVGMTALMLLVQRAEPDDISILLKAGADARKKDAIGRTALDYLNSANCGRPIVKAKDRQWMTFGYSRCNAISSDDYQKSKQLLIAAGARATRVFTAKELTVGAKK